MSTEHQYGREGDNHQRDVVEFPRAVGATIENNRDNEDEQTTRQRDAGFGQAHASTLGPGRVVPHSRSTLVPPDVKLKAGMRPFNEIQIMRAHGREATSFAPNPDLT